VAAPDDGNSDYPPLSLTFLFSDATVRQVTLSAETTAAFFVAKQLLKSLLRPQYSQLLHARYAIKEYPPQAISRGNS
jgi:hypothetical protein